MVKVGDRVNLVNEGGFWLPSNFGKSGTITQVFFNKMAYVEFDGPKGMYGRVDYGKIDRLELIPTTPTYSIPADTETVTFKYADGSTQDIDVKDRARGVPEWVKDGAWVVNKLTGVIARLSTASIGFNARYLTDVSYIFSASDVHERFRPFTNSDWKWGMWAEYRGEKVFVNGRIDNGVTASKPTNGYFFIPFDELTPTTAP